MKNKELELLRTQMNELDHKIMSDLFHRFLLSKEIQRLKSELHKDKIDINREQEILNRLSSEFPQIPKNVVHDIYQIIFSWCRGK